jgi:AcrR family transcriptional regulator
MTATSSDDRRPGRPRDTRVDAAVMAAARELLVEKGFAGTTVEAIATRAGVGKATIYRRWPSREQLLVAVTAAELPDIVVPDSGDLREDLRLAFRMLGDQMRATGPASYILDLIAESTRNPAVRGDFQAFVQQRRSLCAAIVANAKARGELRAGVDPDLVLDLISGPMFYQLLFGDGPPRPAYIERVIDAVLDGILAD